MTEPLQAAVLKAAIADASAFEIDLTIHESIDSTNDWCLQQCKIGKRLPFACFAEAQTQGRGRRGKNWVMPAGSNIAMSIAWAFETSYQQLQFLPLSIAVVIVEVLENFGLTEVKIKWPNDVYVRDKKIAGILVETQPIKSSGKQAPLLAVVIGIGLNHDVSELDEALQQALMLTDVITEAHAQTLMPVPDRMQLAVQLFNKTLVLCQYYPHVSVSCIEKFRQQYDYCQQKTVELILDNNDILSGIAMGINDNAEILVLVDGQQRAFNSASVSVKIE